jgi:hypothetical protein
MVRAKFKVDNIVNYGSQKTVNMTPVTSGSEENKSFSLWTPTGSLSIRITNPEAFDKFEVGKEYYIDFTPAGQ